MNERPVEISVVLPSYNGARTIGSQLEALARQQWAGRWELIYVDNGSTDGSGAIVESFRHRLPGLRMIDATDGRGPAYALNRGVLESAAESIVFCNDDDEVAPGWLAAMAEALQSDELVAGRLEHERLNEPWLLDVRGRPQSDRLPEWGFLPYMPFAFGATIGIHRSLHESIGGFDEQLNPSAEDMDYCWRLQLAGFRIRFVPDAVTHYRMRGDLHSLWKQAHGYGIGNVLAYKKHLRLGLSPAPHPWQKGIRAWLGLCRRLPLALSRPRIALLVWHFGLRTGMLRGSIKHRVVFL